MTYLRPLPSHREVELILIPGCGLLPQTVDPILLRVVIPSTKHIVLMLLEDAQPRAVRKLRSLLVGAPVERILERGHGGKQRPEGLGREARW